MATNSKSGTDYLRGLARKATVGAPLPASEVEAATFQVEHWLQSRGVKYHPAQMVEMSAFDERRSRGNQARDVALVSDSVDRFATAFKAGAKFPPVVAYYDNGKLILIDGNNRQAGAKKASKQYLLTIVVHEDTSSELIQFLTVEANAFHGVTPELSWRVTQALHLVEIGFNDQQAAEAAAITVNQLRNARAVLEADARARAMRIDGFTGLPASSRQQINTIKDDAVFGGVARLAVSTGMTFDEVKNITREVKALGSESARIDHIARLAEDRKIEKDAKKVLGKAANRVQAPKQALVGGIGMIMKVDVNLLMRQILTENDRKAVLSRCNQLIDKLAEIDAVLNTMKLGS